MSICLYKKKKKMSEIEDFISPDRNQIIEDVDGNFTMKIVDIELDVIDCDFEWDECVTIKTEGFSYVKLSIENLKTLIKAIELIESIKKTT